MKSVSNSPERAKGLKEYAKKAIDTVWNSVSDGIGSVAYSSALKTPYLTRYEIVHGSSTGILDVGANSLGIGNSVDRDLRNSLFAGRRKSVEYWDGELEAGRISKTERDIKVAAKIRNLEKRYENKLEEFKTDILPVAFNNFLEGIPDEYDVSDDKRYKGLVNTSKVSHEAGLPSGLASALLGKYGSILVVDPPRSTPPTNKFAEKKVYEVHEPGFVEREFYKIADKVFKYPMKAISKVADLMIEHPLLVGAATVTGIGMAADFKFNDGKIAKNTIDYAKNSGKSIAGGAASFFTGIGDMFDSNQLPVAKIKLDNIPEAGKPVKFNASESFDPDGKIVEYRWIFQDSGSGGLNGIKMEVTPIPTLEKAFPQGTSNKVTLNVVDDKGGIGSATIPQFDVVQPPEPEQPFIMYDGMKIIGDNQSQQDIKWSLDFAKEFSPSDYDFIKQNNKKITATEMNISNVGGNANIDGFSFNKSMLREAIGKKYGSGIIGTVTTGKHESEHNRKYRTTLENTHNITLAMKEFHNEAAAYDAQFKTLSNLSYVTPEMIDAFYKKNNIS